MLGLPDGTRACLFDLDGVLTDTASVHAAAWKQMFDDYLRDARRARRRAVPAVRRRRPTTARTSTASRAWTAPDSFLRLPRHRAARWRRPGDAPDAETAPRPGHRKNDLVQEQIRTRRRRGLRGLGAVPARRRATPGCAPRSCRPGATPRRCSRCAGLDAALRRPGRRRRRRASASGRQARAGHVPAPRPPTSASSQPRRRCSRTPWPASRPVGPAGSASSSASTGSARPTRLREHGADVVVSDLADLLEEDAMTRDPRPFPVEPWAVARARAATWPRSAQPSRCSRCPTGTSACAATSTRASRTACRAPT